MSTGCHQSKMPQSTAEAAGRTQPTSSVFLTALAFSVFCLNDWLVHDYFLNKRIKLKRPQTTPSPPPPAPPLLLLFVLWSFGSCNKHHNCCNIRFIVIV